MVHRTCWLEAIEKGWSKRSVIWLSGVRRAGKTFLCKSLPDIQYFDCELPRVRKMLQDPESFLDEMRGRTVVLDEIHRLPNPSEILKIAADHYPDVRILATGSSTLGAARKFKDTLTGRKHEIFLTPMISRDMEDFGRTDLRHRFLRGGLPPFFLASEDPEASYQEWMESYWAKDIQELFRLEKRHGFLLFVELLLARSGGIFEANSYARPCEVSRQSISNYLRVLEATHVASVLRPWSTHRPTEIVSAPKVYGFDTGFVCHFRGWESLRTEDMGLLWEHFVLDELHAELQTRTIRYWRDKRGHEVDFVVGRRGRPPIAIECKWSEDHFDPAGCLAFRDLYPEGENWLVARDVATPHTRRHGKILVRHASVRELTASLGNPPRDRPGSVE